MTNTAELPKFLAGHEPSGLIPNEPVAQFELGDLRNFVYLILDWNTKRAAIVDPQRDLSKPMSALKEHGFQLDWVLLTHSHHDHVAGVPELIRLDPKLPIGTHSGELHRLSSEALAPGNYQALKDHQIIRLGKIEIEVLHTPGHSAGELCYLLKTKPPYLFTGDTVFIRDCGRTDFPTGSNDEMFASLQRIKQLPPSTIILPGHHYQEECASTLEREMRDSPPFLCQSVKELIDLP
jgi:glyoxylase-like metal-dependent hydrolase (beta-lactamase superfamily II)